MGIGRGKVLLWVALAAGFLLTLLARPLGLPTSPGVLIGGYAVLVSLAATAGWLWGLLGAGAALGATILLLQGENPGIPAVGGLMYFGVVGLVEGGMGMWRRRVKSGARPPNKLDLVCNEVLFDDSPTIVHLVDEEGNVIRRNRASRTILGWPARNTLHLSEYVHPEDIGRLRKELRKLFDLGRIQGVELRFISEGQHSVPVEIHARRLSPKRAVLTALDRSEVMELRRKLAEEEARYRYLIEAAIDTMDSGVVLIDAGGKVIWANKAVERFFGIPRDSCIGLPARKVLERLLFRIDNRAEFEDMVRYAYGEGVAVENVECKVRPGLQREERVLQYSSYPIENGGRIDHYVDITQLKRLEADLRRKTQDLEEMNRNLKEYDRAVAHDLKAPARTIVSLVDQVLKQNPDGILPQDVRLNLELIREVGENMIVLIRDLLRFSTIKVEPSSFEPVDLKRVVGRVCRDLSAILDGVEVVVDPGLPVVSGIETLIAQVYRNLIQNAVKFNDKPVPRIEVGYEGEQEGLCVLYVRDNGIGIREEFHEAIFRIFNKLDPESEGTGAGLAICRRIVEEHGGRIWVKSRVGEGSTFYFTLPKARVRKVEEQYVR
ncbi:PAS domain-containing protein [Candidatus Bipolaricaulota bacterium]|nr:PAS domain-containing protein [Candidatus Bipolaricaulota bacterium]